MKLNIWAFLCAVSLFGCASKPDVNINDYSNQKTDPPESNLSSAINLTPFSKYTDQWNVDTANGSDFSDSYTKLVILSHVNANGVDRETNLNSKEKKNGFVGEELQYKSRSVFAKLFSDLEFSINLSTHVKAGDFESTVPLATIGHSSRLNEGEQWTRVIHHTKTNFPLFLVRSNGSSAVPEVKISVNGSRNYASRGAANAVQIAVGVANSTSKLPDVITSLTNESAREQARAMDDVISKLFSTGITEEHWTDRDLRYWSAKANRLNGVEVQFIIPQSEKDWNSEPKSVGTWSITFDYPRPSIFVDWRICNNETNVDAKVELPRCKKTKELAREAIERDLEASQILNMALVKQENGLGTIKGYLSQQDWYTSSLVALSKKDSNESQEILAHLCTNIKNEVVQLGLNAYDASIVAAAVGVGMPIPFGSDKKPHIFNEVHECTLVNSATPKFVENWLAKNST